jgi:hypothetical protein
MLGCLCIFAFTTGLLYFSGLPSNPDRPTPSPVPTREAIPVSTSTPIVVEVPISDPPAIAARLGNVSEAPRVLAEKVDPLSAGVKNLFWVSNVDRNDTQQIQAELVYVTEHVYFWVDDRVDYELEDVRRVVDYFEEATYPTLRSFFGSEWSPGVDGDEHLYILYARGLGPSVAGLFFSKDEFSPLVYEYSNSHEMFYLSADNVDLKGTYVNTVLAHEYQHMIQWNVDRNEETWMNEGLSQLAEHILGFDIGGFDILYSNDPDQALLRWPVETADAGKHYGQSFLFITYLYDQLGPEAMQQMIFDQANGLEAVDRILAERQGDDSLRTAARDADDLFLDWAISLALQNPGLKEGQYGLHSYINPPVARVTESFDTCDPVTYPSQVAQYGVDYVGLRCDGDFTLEFSGRTQTRVVPTDFYSGDYALWSYYGDESNMTLTRSFDFTEVSGPISLSYWTWYKIEDGYDYVYLIASADGGETWEILRTPSGTSEDPAGNSFGWAYTGNSGGAGEPEWIEEIVDLSHYAGKEVMIQIEYVTDTALTTEGFLLDDVSIEPIGYFEDFENGIGQWQAKGFIRLKNEIPQTYHLALIERGETVQVSYLELDAFNRLVLPIRSSDRIDDRILVITATSRDSWLLADYQLELVPSPSTAP